MLPAIDAHKKIVDARKRSAKLVIARAKVPAIKPACTAPVSQPIAEGSTPQSSSKAADTPLTLNHSEQPKN